MSVRRRFVRWTSWFALVNAALLALVGLRYLWYYSPLAPVAGRIYAVIAFLGHMSALACIPLVLLVPVMLLVPRPQVVLPLALFLAGAGASFLLLDTSVFAENRYHLNVLWSSTKMGWASRDTAPPTATSSCIPHSW